MHLPHGVRKGVLVRCPICKKQYQWQGRVGSACDEPECRAEEARFYQRMREIRAADGLSPPPDPNQQADV